MLHMPTHGRANLRFNHRKILLSDGQTALTGGMNLAAEDIGHPRPAPLAQPVGDRDRPGHAEISTTCSGRTGTARPGEGRSRPRNLAIDRAAAGAR